MAVVESVRARASRWALCVLLAFEAGCSAVPPNAPPPTDAATRIEVAFSPEAGAEALVLKMIGSAQHSLCLAGYSFTSPTVVRALIDAQKRGVDVQVLIDERDNRGKSNVAAINLIAGAGIPIRTISAYAIHHDKYIVIDGRTTETGSFNYTRAAARSNSKNVLMVWNDPQLAASNLARWQSRWVQGTAVRSSF